MGPRPPTLRGQASSVTSGWGRGSQEELSCPKMEGWHPSLGVSEGITTRTATPPEAWPHLLHEGRGLAGPAAGLGCWCQGLRVGRLCPALRPAALVSSHHPCPHPKPVGVAGTTLDLRLSVLRRGSQNSRCGCVASSVSPSLSHTQLGRKMIDGCSLFCSVARWPHSGALAPFLELVWTRVLGRRVGFPG